MPKQKRKRPPLKKKETDPQVLALAARLIEQRKAKIAKAERHARRQLRGSIVSKDAMLKSMRNNKESGGVDGVDVAEGQRRALKRKKKKRQGLDPRVGRDLSRWMGWPKYPKKSPGGEV